MSESLLPPGGGYRELYSYQKAEAVYDLTYYFFANYLKRGDRTVDQMVQAARSGKQNIAEGSAASSTSKEFEIKLMNVAKASLEELLPDYEDYLRTRQHRQWAPDSAEVTAMRKLGKEHNDTAYYMQLALTRPPETLPTWPLAL
jgi:four helix bundle protein